MRGENNIICAGRPAQRVSLGRMHGLLGLAVTMAIALTPGHSAHAETTLKSAAASGGVLSASTSLDFRITVLPSLTLALRPDGVRIQSNAGGLVVQRQSGNEPPSLLHAAPLGGAQLRSPVVDASLSGGAAGVGATLLTIAAP